jgi:hypothetical protein
VVADFLYEHVSIRDVSRAAQGSRFSRGMPHADAAYFVNWRQDAASRSAGRARVFRGA